MSPLSAKERKIAEQAELQELQHLHDELDATVADAYGRPVDLDEQEVLRRLLELNRQCFAEETIGMISRLRSGFQTSLVDKCKEKTHGYIEKNRKVTSIAMCFRSIQ